MWLVKRFASSGILAICAIPIVLSAGSVQAAPMYFPGTGHWYEHITVPELTCWSACSVSAAALGGYLATIGSQAENDFVLSIASLQTDALIGGRRYSSTDPWEWVTGEPWVYENWDVGKPGGLQYARMVLPPGGGRTPGKWFDFYECDWIPDGGDIGFVVEYDREPCPFSAQDCDCNGILNVQDVVCAVNAAFRGAPPNPPCCAWR